MATIRSCGGVGWLCLAVAFTACGRSGGGDPSTDPDAARAAHGDVAFALRRVESEAGSPFAGTQRVVATLDYRECLVDFYAGDPDWRQDGELGEPVFEIWQEELCADALFDCAVAEIDQDLESSPPRLTVTYDVEGDIEDHEVDFGPLPHASLAGCNGGADPIVRLGDASAVYGEDANGEVIWGIESFNPDQAATGQGLPITIRAGSR